MPADPRFRLSLWARAAIVERGRVLLEAAQGEDGGPSYRLPGGELQPGETAAECLRRRLAEDAALEVHVGRLLYVSEHLYLEAAEHRHDLVLYLHALVLGGADDTGPQQPSLGWHALDELDGPLLPDLVAHALRDDIEQGFRRPPLHLVANEVAAAARRPSPFR